MIELRRLLPSDAQFFVDHLADDYEAVSRMGTIPWPCTLDAMLEWMKDRAGPNTPSHAILCDGAFAGMVKVSGTADFGELGYWIGRDYRGRGLATKASQMRIEIARAEGFRTVEASTFPDNAASENVLRRLGFIPIGQDERDFPARGGVHLLNIWQLTL